MDKNDLSAIYEIGPLLHEAEVKFTNETPTAIDLINWLDSFPVTDFPTLMTVSEEEKEAIIRAPVINTPPYSMPTNLPQNFIGMDPVTGAVLIAGLGYLLNLLAGERRHKETLGKEPPKEGCEQKNNEGIVCGLPVKYRLISKGKFLLKSCTRSPEPHLKLIKVVP